MGGRLGKRLFEDSADEERLKQLRIGKVMKQVIMKTAVSRGHPVRHKFDDPSAAFDISERRTLSRPGFQGRTKFADKSGPPRDGFAADFFKEIVDGEVKLRAE